MTDTVEKKSRAVPCIESYQKITIDLQKSSTAFENPTEKGEKPTICIIKIWTDFPTF